MAQFTIGNKDAEKWTEEEAIELFTSIREASKLDTVNSLQAAILSSGYYSSGFYYLIGKFPVLESFKKDALDILASKVNEKALTGEFSAAPAIWRMKQCGEVDKQEIKNETTQTIVWNEQKTYEAEPKANDRT